MPAKDNTAVIEDALALAHGLYGRREKVRIHRRKVGDRARVHVCALESS